jgi:hypothetical protein
VEKLHTSANRFSSEKSVLKNQSWDRDVFQWSGACLVSLAPEFGPQNHKTKNQSFFFLVILYIKCQCLHEAVNGHYNKVF